MAAKHRQYKMTARKKEQVIPRGFFLCDYLTVHEASHYQEG